MFPVFTKRRHVDLRRVSAQACRPWRSASPVSRR
ncbi:putative leader peptide [Saccharopolyspora phatthalungensis]